MTERRGFTLIEVLVAVVLATGVAMLGRAFLEGAGDQARRLTEAADHQQSRAESNRLLQSLLAHARSLPTDSVSFLGTPRGMFVRSLCPVAGGWVEPCNVTLAVLDTAPGLVLRTSNGLVAEVASGTDSVALRFLALATDGGSWHRNWPKPTEVPLALGIIVDGDTLIMRVGR